MVTSFGSSQVFLFDLHEEVVEDADDSLELEFWRECAFDG